MTNRRKFVLRRLFLFDHQLIVCKKVSPLLLILTAKVSPLSHGSVSHPSHPPPFIYANEGVLIWTQKRNNLLSQVMDYLPTCRPDISEWERGEIVSFAAVRTVWTLRWMQIKATRNSFGSPNAIDRNTHQVATLSQWNKWLVLMWVLKLIAQQPSLSQPIVQIFSQEGLIFVLVSYTDALFT